MQYVIGVDSFEYQFWPKLFLEEVCITACIINYEYGIPNLTMNIFTTFIILYLFIYTIIICKHNLPL